MQFTRSDLSASLAALVADADVEQKAKGENFRLEENVGDARQRHFEDATVGEENVCAAADQYFRVSIEGVRRGHKPSTFDADLNNPALLPRTIEPNQKIVRLERIDGLIGRDPDLDLSRLSEALQERDHETLASFLELFETFNGERPAFAAFKSELEDDLDQEDWIEAVIERMGLYHFYDGVDKCFALMEYTADEVLKQAAGKALDRPFALATVLECRNNPAFFPTPKGARTGFTVDLRPRAPDRATVREVLHCRITYGVNHMQRLARWTGGGRPDIAEARAPCRAAQ